MSLGRYKDELGLLKLADATPADIERNARAISIGARQPVENHVITWFLPPVSHALKGGVRTVFMLAQNFSEHWDTLNQFVIYSYSGRDLDTEDLCKSLKKHFPNLRFTVFVFRRGIDDPANIPASNASFCTLWTTAYLQLKYNVTARKFYLMQDYEPSFYQAGNIYGVIEQTYRFGYSCIANTEGVAHKYLQYSDDVTSFSPGVDRDTFYAELNRTTPNNPARVVFYGRPSNPRNCFLLGLETLKILKQNMGNSVEIISVGEEWDESEFGVSDVIENRGLLSTMEEVASLYRSSDLGLVFMMTPHPSYQPLEYMASGCVTATNINEPNQWLLNEANSAIIEPLPATAAQKIQKLLENSKEWHRLRNNALETVSLLNWDEVFSTVRSRLM